MKGYAVFNAERIEELLEFFYTRPESKRPGAPRTDHAKTFFR